VKGNRRLKDEENKCNYVHSDYRSAIFSGGKRR
jgi:hypothetical protein